MRRQLALAAVAVAALLLGITGGQPAAKVASAATLPVHTFTAAGGQSITVNPPLLDWGTVMPAAGPYGVGQQEVVVYVNSQSAPQPIFQTLNIIGPNASEFYVTQNFCVGQVQNGCGIYLAFMPTLGAGPRSATLQIYDDQAGSPQTVALKANVAGAGAVVTPFELRFGNVPVGTTSAPQTLTVKSTGTSALNITGMQFRNPPVDPFQKLSDTCTGMSLAPGSTCTVQVTFGPGSGAFNDFVDIISVVSNAPVGPGAAAYLYGSGVGTPSVGPLSPYTFGGLNVGVTQTAKFPIHNSGNGNLLVTSDTIAGANPTNFVIASDTCAGATVAAGNSCEIDVSAHAVAAGSTYSASLTLHDNTSTSDVIALSVGGVNGSASISPASLAFGTVALGGTASKTVTLTSNGPDPLWESGTSLSGASPGDFNVTPDGCVGKNTVSGSTCTLIVNFAPNTNGGIAPTATLTVYDSTGSHQVTLTGAVSGSGIFYSANPLQFGTVAKGSSVTLMETVFNQTSGGLTISQIFTQNDFSIIADNCSNIAMAPGASCTFKVVFTPSSSGVRSISIVLANSGPPFFSPITATGNGLVPSPSVIIYNNFPNTPWHTSSQKTVTFTNLGTLDWNVTSIAPADTTNWGVAAGTDQCSGKVIAPNASCSIGFLFTPSLPQGYDTTLNITSNATIFTPIHLTGAGIAPWAGMNPTLSIGSQEIGRTLTGTVTVRNIMEAHLHVTGATFSGQQPVPFSIASQSCQDVPRGATCQIQVQFAPAFAGLVFSTMTLIDDELNPKSVVVSGNGLANGPCGSATLGASPGPTAGVGNVVVFYADTGGCGQPQYRFLLKTPGSSSSVEVQAYSPGSTWTWETAGLPIGAYTITVQIKDLNSTAAFESTASVTEQLAYSPCSSATLSADRVSPAQLGGTIVLSATSTVCGTPQYQFWMLPPGSSTWLVAQWYSSSSTYMWNTTAWPTGSYLFIVWARDAHSPGTASNVLGTWDAYSMLQFTLTATPTCSLLNGTVMPFGFANWGAPVTMSMFTRYCPNPLYQFWMLPPGSSTWLVAQFYSSNAGFAWNTGRPWPNVWVGGTYRFVVWSRDASSPGLYSNSLGTWDTSVMFSYYLQPQVCSSLNVNHTFMGPTLYLSAQATLSCQNPLYEFWVLYPGASTWTLFQAYSPNGNFSFNFNGVPRGRYYFSTWARDASSAGVYTAPGYGTYDSYDEGYVDN